ncbi:FabD/lysophospholipase-like protein [Aaosphaeria arxii CBS 175.79]|uniref:Lysophospholipase n=1 Tax=Aaosphaeria arxii CBS 175.79 TaxID=1450172 RepID=A0A6A5XN28_9PLEO|nr:FabD/lysophospholipase-like protein [Aaosphaeria arxii CBS 175.79]KAF2014150.1 FabD/lysophospholipase-like protein [Aaosphaeria arxii CBS 175.79]
MAPLRNLSQIRQQWLPGPRRSLYTRSGILHRSNAATVARRFGTPLFLAVATVSVLSSPTLSSTFCRPVHNDAPKSSAWKRLAPSFLQSNDKENETTTAKEAEETVNDSTGSGNQKPPPQSRIVTDKRDGDSRKIEDASEDAGPWLGFTTKLSNASISFSTLGDTIADYVLPNWAKLLPAYITKIQNELSMSPGSLAEEIWHDANNPEINEEILWDASVRVSNDLCPDEKKFLEKRSVFTRRGLARYLDIPESKIHPDDVPVIAMCGSGGGLRALVAGTSSYLSTHEAGLFDCVTYTAGVSGSCWLQTLYYSEITQRSHAKLIRHLKNRLGVHIAFPPDALELIASAPTNKHLLSGLVEKAKGTPDAEFGIVDIYGLLLAARLLVPRGELSVDERDFKISNQRIHTDTGSQPLPIYTAVRHEIPLTEQSDIKDPVAAEAKARKEAWFQWFEFTPYEFWCEEWEAGIPTWALGRKFENGRTVWRENGLSLPELRVPMLMGIWGSAFCATLSHYYREIRPAVKGLTGFGGLDDMISERNDDLSKVHPINPAAMPNFAYGMRNYLPATCPESVFDAPNLELMDAGMSNNLPIYPLLRPGRNVDILIAFDASADVKTDNWLKVAEGYARQRDIKGWPVGAGWPSDDETIEELRDDLSAAQAQSPAEAREKIQEAQAQDNSSQDPSSPTSKSPKSKAKDLGYCNIWAGTTEERTSEPTSPPSPNLSSEDNWETIGSADGITVIYFPFLANPKVKGVDPKTSDFMSTWNFVYTPEQIDSVVELARTNFQEGAERTKRTVRAVYERKKRMREEREAEALERRRRWKLRQGRAGGRRVGEDDHGDHFS